MDHCPTGHAAELDTFYFCCEGNACCHSGDKSCTPGDTCCQSECNDPGTCSYTESGCSGSAGSAHACTWDSKHDMCVAGLQ